MWQLCVPLILVVLVGIVFALLFSKKLRWLIFVVLIVVVLMNWKYECFTYNISTEKTTGQSLKVMTWNIDGSSPAILENISKISETILKEDADIVFIAEDYYECCDSLDALLKAIYPYSTHIVCNDSHYFYSKYPLSKSKWIGMEIDSISSIIQCSMAMNGHKINLFGCHLSSNNYFTHNSGLRPEHINNIFDFWRYIKNIQTASDLRKLEAELIVDSLHMENPTIILGDMNDVSGSPALRTFKGIGLKNAWWNSGLGYGATIHNPIPFRIDHILYNKKMRLHSISRIGADGLSDHDALLAIFNLNTNIK